MDSSLYVFVEDLRGEGVDKVLDRVADYGVKGVPPITGRGTSRRTAPPA